MIQLPRRSVTRFFIPMIDVLTLLFCVFLLLPAFRESEPDNPDKEKANLKQQLLDKASELERLRDRVAELQAKLEDPAAEGAALRKQVRALRAEVERLQSKVRVLEKRLKAPLEQRLAIRILEIDPKDGRLFAYEPGRPPPKKYVETAAAAEALILRNKREVLERHKGDETVPELHYLFVFPRVDSAYPTEGQVRQYEKWFKDVSRSFDQPGGP